jgi:hypothetical protein
LVIVGKEFDVAGVWLTGVEYHRPESTQHKVIGIELKDVDAAERSRCGGPESTLRKVIDVELEGVGYRGLEST